MVEIVHKNVDQTAYLAVTGLMESVNLAVIQGGKDLTVTQVLTFIVIPFFIHVSYSDVYKDNCFFFPIYVQLSQCNPCQYVINSRLYINVYKTDSLLKN